MGRDVRPRGVACHDCAGGNGDPAAFKKKSLIIQVQPGDSLASAPFHEAAQKKLHRAILSQHFRVSSEFLAVYVDSRSAPANNVPLPTNTVPLVRNIDPLPTNIVPVTTNMVPVPANMLFFFQNNVPLPPEHRSRCNEQLFPLQRTWCNSLATTFRHHRTPDRAPPTFMPRHPRLTLPLKHAPSFTMHLEPSFPA